MNYIVDPKWFYFIDVISDFEIFAVFAGISSLLVGGIILCVVYVESDFKSSPKETHFGKALAIVGIILCFVSVFIPSKETLIEMEIASRVTYDSAETVVQMIQEATDYILEKTGEKEVKDD